MAKKLTKTYNISFKVSALPYNKETCKVLYGSETAFNPDYMENSILQEDMEDFLSWVDIMIQLKKMKDPKNSFIRRMARISKEMRKTFKTS